MFHQRSGKVTTNGVSTISLTLVVVFFFLPVSLSGTVSQDKNQESKKETEDTEKKVIKEATRRRILDRPVSRSGALKIVDGLKYPFTLFGRALDKGARKVEEDHALERVEELQVAAIAKGFEPLFGGMDPGAGLAFGVNIVRKDIFGTRARLEFPLEYSTNQYAGLGAYLIVPLSKSGKYSLRTGFHYYDRPEDDFFGLGPRSGESARSNFRLEKRIFSTALEAQLSDRVTSAIQLRFSNTGISEGRDNNFPDIQDSFPAQSVPGLSGDEILSIGVTVDWNRLNHPTLPTAGGRVSAETAYLQDTDGQDAQFMRYGLQASQYVPIDNEHVFVVRFLGLINEERGGTSVPLSEKIILGGSKTMRGFREFRFRDDNVILVNFEYRWQVWKYADFILFFDEGQVAAEPGDFALSDFRSSRGLGVRFKGKESQIMRLDFGHSIEGWRFYLSTQMVF